MDIKDEIVEYYKLSFYDNCRICLDLHEDTTSIETLKQSNDMNSLLSYFSIEVMDDDRYPCGICASCIDQLNNIISFKEKCEQTFNYLTSVLQNETEEIDEDGNRYIIQYLENENEIPTAVEMSEHNYQKNDDESLPEIDESSTNKYQTKPFSCSMCWKRFTRKCKLREHEKKFHGEVPHPSANILRPFVCTICFAAFTRRFTLNIHKRKHHGEDVTVSQKLHNFKGKPFACSVCFTTFTQKNALNEHRKKFHGISETPPIQRDVKRFACSDCSMTFTREFILNRHKEKYHEVRDPMTVFDDNPQKPFICNICYTSFSRGDTLNDHKRKYHNDTTVSNDELSSKEKKFVCTVCSRTFARQVMLSKHHEKYHTDIRPPNTEDENSPVIEPKKPYFCLTCSKSFSRQAALREHIEKCHDSNPPPDDSVQIKMEEESPFEFECRHCAQSFPCKTTLIAHITNVHENREYSFDLLCALCGEVFCSKYDLTNHNKLFHADDRHFQCNYCHRRFKNHENCRRHEKTIHLERKPMVATPPTDKAFVCDLCPRTFSHKPTLDVHKKLVHKQIKKEQT